MQALHDELPDARVRGIAAGLHVTVELMDDDDEQAIEAEARSPGIEMKRWPSSGRPTRPRSPRLSSDTHKYPRPHPSRPARTRCGRASDEERSHG